MFISYGDLIGILICGSVSAFMLVLLLVANYQLLRENRFLKHRLRAWRKACAARHAEVPF
jgi:hypothetical protein